MWDKEKLAKGIGHDVESKGYFGAEGGHIPGVKAQDDNGQKRHAVQAVKLLHDMVQPGRSEEISGANEHPHRADDHGHNLPGSRHLFVRRILSKQRLVKIQGEQVAAGYQGTDKGAQNRAKDDGAKDAVSPSRQYGSQQAG